METALCSSCKENRLSQPQPSPPARYQLKEGWGGRIIEKKKKKQNKTKHRSMICAVEHTSISRASIWTGLWEDSVKDQLEGTEA